MGYLSEVLPKFERFATEEESRLNKVSQEILEAERILKRCPSLWNRSIYFEDIEANLTVYDGRLLMERGGDKKPLIEYRVKDRMSGYHCLHKFLELIMQGQG